jgi:acyl carrier protein
LGEALQKPGASKSDIAAVCIDSLAEILRMPRERIDPNTRFDRLGLDSGMIVFLLLSLEERLGMTLVPETIYEHPTVTELSKHLAEQTAGQ